MSAEHTPGPWKVADAFDDYFEVAVVDEHGSRVCEVCPRAEWTDEEKKNVRLIAAAPDLLAALKRVIELLDSGVLVRNISGDGSPNWAMKMLELIQDLNSIQSAIAKAEGH